MSQDFSLDQKKITFLVAVFLVLLFLVYFAGYLSGIIVGLPVSERLPVVPPRVEPQPALPVVTMQVPRVAKDPEPEIITEVTALEPEEADIPEERLYSVQVGAFKTQARADAQVLQLITKGYEPYIYHGANSKGLLWYTVRITDFADVDEAIRAAREFRTREDSAVVLTHYNSLMLIKTSEGKRIEIKPFENASPGEETVDGKEGADDLQAAPADGVVEDDETGTDEEPVETGEAGESSVFAETQPDKEEPDSSGESSLADGSAVGADAGKTAGLEEDEKQPESSEPGSADQPLEAVIPKTVTETDQHITFAIPEKPTEEDESVGSLITTAEAKKYSVQVGAFLNRENAEKFAEKLKGLGYPAYVFLYNDSKGNAWSAVRAGDFFDPDAANNAAIEFQEKEKITAIVTRIESISMVYVK